MSGTILSEPRNKTQEFGPLAYQISRRRLLTLFGQGLIGASFLTYFGCIPKSGRKIDFSAESRNFSESEKVLMEEVQEHLLPSGPDSPGARECLATHYIQLVLAGPDIDPEDAKVIPQGLKAISDLCQKEYDKGFQNLNEDEKEAILRKYEDDEQGDAWLTLVMTFTIEAFLGDPAHGGNPNGIAWQWLEHVPGFPRPPLVTIGTKA